MLSGRELKARVSSCLQVCIRCIAPSSSPSPSRSSSSPRKRKRGPGGTSSVCITRNEVADVVTVLELVLAYTSTGSSSASHKILPKLYHDLPDFSRLLAVLCTTSPWLLAYHPTYGSVLTLVYRCIKLYSNPCPADANLTSKSQAWVSKCLAFLNHGNRPHAAPPSSSMASARGGRGDHRLFSFLGNIGVGEEAIRTTLMEQFQADHKDCSDEDERGEQSTVQRSALLRLMQLLPFVLSPAPKPGPDQMWRFDVIACFFQRACTFLSSAHPAVKRKGGGSLEGADRDRDAVCSLRAAVEECAEVFLPTWVLAMARHAAISVSPDQSSSISFSPSSSHKAAWLVHSVSMSVWCQFPGILRRNVDEFLSASDTWACASYVQIKAYLCGVLGLVYDVPHDQIVMLAQSESIDWSVTVPVLLNVQQSFHAHERVLAAAPSLRALFRFSVAPVLQDIVACLVSCEIHDTPKSVLLVTLFPGLPADACGAMLLDRKASPSTSRVLGILECAPKTEWQRNGCLTAFPGWVNAAMLSAADVDASLEKERLVSLLSTAVLNMLPPHSDHSERLLAANTVMRALCGHTSLLTSENRTLDQLFSDFRDVFGCHRCGTQPSADGNSHCATEFVLLWLLCSVCGNPQHHISSDAIVVKLQKSLLQPMQLSIQNRTLAILVLSTVYETQLRVRRTKNIICRLLALDVLGHNTGGEGSLFHAALQRAKTLMA